MQKFVVPIIYRGQANFIVKAENEEAAKTIALTRFRAGDAQDELGNEWEEFEKFGEVEAE